MGAMSQAATISKVSSGLVNSPERGTPKLGAQPVKSHLGWFKTIPPERIGLNGEYDYYGLSKRVYQHLNDLVGTSIMQRLKVRQRGRVILLSGYVPTAKLLEQLKQATLSVEGADAVETCVMSIEASWAASA
ncbi:MAG: hypothetical protein AAF152_08995 [Cyanobacteria bacterium P01_A01_bin.114]